MEASVLQEIIDDVLSFEFPLIPIKDSIAALELFHGPTIAFKDVGARFMARCLGHFSPTKTRKGSHCSCCYDW